MCVLDGAFQNLSHHALSSALLDTEVSCQLVARFQVRIASHRAIGTDITCTHGCSSLLDHVSDAAGLGTRSRLSGAGNLGTGRSLTSHLRLGCHGLGRTSRCRVQRPCRFGQCLLRQSATLTVGEIGENAVGQLRAQVMRLRECHVRILVTVQLVVVGTGRHRRSRIVLAGLVVVFHAGIFASSGLLHADVQIDIVRLTVLGIRSRIDVIRDVSLDVRFVFGATRAFTGGLATIID